MNKLTNEKRAQVVAALVEGNSIRSIVRMTGVAKNTVAKLLVDLGTACTEYQDKALRNLKCRRVQVDEVWAFCGCKEKNVPEELKGTLGLGDVWTFTAIDADTKLVPCWHVGKRDLDHATAFIKNLAARIASRIQLTTDGHKMYLDAVETGFAHEVDYAMLIKLYTSGGITGCCGWAIEKKRRILGALFEEVPAPPQRGRKDTPDEERYAFYADPSRPWVWRHAERASARRRAEALERGA